MPVVEDHFRAYARRRVNLEATLRDNVGSLSREVRVRDLSLGGACVEIASIEFAKGAHAGFSPLAPASIVILELSTPMRWDPLTLQGKVAWIGPGAAVSTTRIGVRFEHRDSSLLFVLFKLLGLSAHA